MKKASVVLLVAFSVTQAFGLFGPGSVNVVQVYPPKINLGDISRISVLPIKFDHRDIIMNKLSAMLHENLPDGLEIIERDQLNRILSEQNIVASELFDLDTSPEFGSIKGVDALIYGTATVFGVEDEHYTETVEWTKTEKINGKKKKVKQSAEAEATKRVGSLNVVFKVVDVSTGTVIGQEEFRSREEHVYVAHKKSYSNNPLPDEARIKDGLIDKAILPFTQYLFPYKVSQKIGLDDECKTDKCKEAIDLLKVDMYDMAEEVLQEELEAKLANKETRKKKRGQDKGVAAIYYHLGVIEEARDNMDGALELYKKATVMRIKKKAGHIKDAVERVNKYIDLWAQHNGE